MGKGKLFGFLKSRSCCGEEGEGLTSDSGDEIRPGKEHSLFTQPQERLETVSLIVLLKMLGLI